MSKLKVGHKQNSFLNGAWAGHVRYLLKKITNGKRRCVDKKIVYNELNNKT